MNQYIIILLWTLFLGLFASREQYSYMEGDEVVSVLPSRFYCFLLVLPLIISAGFRTSFGDQGYKIAFRATTGTGSFTELVATIQSGAKGPGYYVIQYLGNVLFGNNAELFFLVLATLQMLALIRLYRKYSSNVWIAFLIFVASTDYLSWMQNGIRQFTAVTIIILFSDWIYEKKLIKICAVILIASTIHNSALIMLPIVFIVQGDAFNKKTILAMIATVFVIIALGRLIPSLDLLLKDTEYSNAITDWQQSKNDGVNFLRVVVYSIPTILSIIKFKLIKNSNNNIIHITCNMGIMSTLIYIVGMFTSGIYVGRLPIYLSLFSNGILLPWLLDSETNNTRKVLIFSMIFLYIVFYWYQTHLIWGII